MPRYRNAANVDLEEFVVPIVHELQEGAQPTPRDPFAIAGENPVIIETPTGLGERFHVTVIWDKWGGLPVEDRNKIIMEAYRRVVGAEAANISLTLGVTRPQYQQMTTTLGQFLGT
jgi:hypothetical protein